MVFKGILFFGLIATTHLAAQQALALQPEVQNKIRDLILTPGKLDAPVYELLKIEDRTEFLKAWAKQENAQILRWTAVEDKILFLTLDGIGIEKNKDDVQGQELLDESAVTEWMEADGGKTLLIEATMDAVLLKLHFLTQQISKLHNQPSLEIKEGLSIPASMALDIEVAAVMKALALAALKEKEDHKEDLDPEIFTLTTKLLQVEIKRSAYHRSATLEALQILLDNYKSYHITAAQAYSIDQVLHDKFEEAANAVANGAEILNVMKNDPRIENQEELKKSVARDIETAEKLVPQYRAFITYHANWVENVFNVDPENQKVQREQEQLNKVIEGVIEEERKRPAQEDALPRF